MIENGIYWISAGAGLLIALVFTAAVTIIRLKATYDRKLAEVESQLALNDEKYRSLSVVADDLRSQLNLCEKEARDQQALAADLNAAKAARDAQIVEIKGQLEKTVSDRNDQAERLMALQDQVVQYKSEIAELGTTLAEERKQADEKIALLHEAREQLKSEFENLAQQILKKKARNFPNKTAAT